MPERDTGPYGPSGGVCSTHGRYLTPHGEHCPICGERESQMLSEPGIDAALGELVDFHDRITEDPVDADTMRRAIAAYLRASAR